MTRTFSLEEQKRAVVYFAFELALLEPPVSLIVEKMMQLMDDEAENGEPLVDVDVSITEVLVSGTKLDCTQLPYRLETCTGIAKKEPNTLLEVIKKYWGRLSLVGSESNILSYLPRIGKMLRLRLSSPFSNNR